VAKLSLKRGTTSKLVRVFIQDTTKTDGSGLTGLVYNSAGLVAYYSREGDAGSTAISVVSASAGTWTSGGFVAVDGTNLPGVYELGLPNAVLASGNSVVVMLKGAANMAPLVLEIELTAVDNQDGAAYGLSRVDAAVSSRQSGSAAVTLPASPPANYPTADGSGRVTLAPTGLDSVNTTDVVSDADARSTLTKMLRAMYNRLYNNVTQTSSQQKVYNDSGSLVSTMSVADDGTTATKGKSA
jgi:hypothetical protein